MSIKTTEQDRAIPPEILERIPLMKPEYLPLLKRLQEHRHAPKWNYTCGDRLTARDVVEIDVFTEKLHRHRQGRGTEPPDFIVDRLAAGQQYVPLFRERLKGLRVREDFQRIPPSTREDMAVRLDRLVPENADLRRLIVNPTSGTTGHPIQAPNHPRAIGCYNPMLFFSLQRHGVIPELRQDTVVCMLLCAQQDTAVYATVKPVLQGAGFAKINLYPHAWREPDSAAAYIREMKPYFLTGDPFSFAQSLEILPDYRPAALVSTSIGLPAALAKKLRRTYCCPVVDFYSLNETGPIAYSCPEQPGEFHLLPHDLHIEVTDAAGRTLPEGEEGEITVSGGRNPYLPLLRYRTGDRAKLQFAPCACGDPMPRIVAMQARHLVIFRTPAGRLVNPVDISRILRLYPIVQHRFIQKKDFSCHLGLRLLYGSTLAKEDRLRGQLLALFDKEVSLRISYDLKPEEKEGKISAYIKID
jgi:phenylacetate-CoA ligase